jgi:hypothetical protein
MGAPLFVLHYRPTSAIRRHLLVRSTPDVSSAVRISDMNGEPSDMVFERSTRQVKRRPLTFFRVVYIACIQLRG